MARFVPNISRATKSILLHPMELLREGDDVKSRFDAFRDNVNLGAILWHGLCQTYHRLRNQFCCTRWNSGVTWMMLNLISMRSETVLILVRSCGTISAEHTTGSEINFVAPNGTPR